LHDASLGASQSAAHVFISQYLELFSWIGATTAEYEIMSDQPRSSLFPTQHDISRLRQTATDAVNDMGDAQSVRSLAEKVGQLANSSREYVSRYPLRTMGAALAVGFVIGIFCTCSSKRNSSD
jgi:ElaB/YqjD/DUF883 family membrane-anchored ribosome-binding protein